jgi:hypothetical protein
VESLSWHGKEIKTCPAPYQSARTRFNHDLWSIIIPPSMSIRDASSPPQSQGMPGTRYIPDIQSSQTHAAGFDQIDSEASAMKVSPRIANA